MPQGKDFWEYVQKTDTCWFWIGGRSYGGYGLQAAGRGNSRLAHRHSYELANGPIPEGMLVLHKCDNPSCVNPKHLSLGTHADNTHDMCSKKRGVGKLTQIDVDKIRELREAGSSQKEIARLFSVNQSTVSRITNNERWKIVTHS